MKSKTFVFFLLFGACAIICAFVVANIFVGITFGHNYTVVKKQVFYAVSVYSFQSENEANLKKQDVATLGGAGFVYKSGANFHVIASVYETKQHAQNVAGNLAQNYNTNIIEFVLPKVKVAKNTIKAFEVFKKTNEYFLQTSIKLDKGEISKQESLSNSLALITEIDEITNTLSGNNTKEIELRVVLKTIKENILFLNTAENFNSFFKYTSLKCIVLMQNYFTCIN